MNDDELDLEAGGGRVIIRRTPREEMCEELREEAADVVSAIDSLEFGVGELELDGDHELYDQLADARAAMEQVKWLLDSLREDEEEHNRGRRGEEEQQPDP